MGAEEELAQGLVRRRVAKRPSKNAAGSSPALVSSMMEPIALTNGCRAVLFIEFELDQKLGSPTYGLDLPVSVDS